MVGEPFTDNQYVLDLQGGSPTTWTLTAHDAKTLTTGAETLSAS